MNTLSPWVEFQARANTASRCGQHRAALLWQARADAAIPQNYSKSGAENRPESSDDSDKFGEVRPKKRGSR